MTAVTEPATFGNQPAIENEAPTPTSPLTGFNARQLELILETIAGNTRTLQQMLMLLQTEIDDEYAQSVCIDAAKDLATAIGAMADEAIGGGVIGNAACWHFGPNFNSTGKAVQA
ncbi:hypothetical protein [Variovorax sp. CAN15]|uniref:hypothetical protein n=1 Tax=Variovorax sp. CAN15 TaxID=3046727 RepID=UPI00264A48E4|nr:hypothetical protein [Variovorax sp. CAN15]